MTQYILSVNESSKKGRIIIELLDEFQSKKELKLMSMEEYEDAEEKALIHEMRKGLKTKSLSLEEAKNQLARIKRSCRDESNRKKEIHQ